MSLNLHSAAHALLLIHFPCSSLCLGFQKERLFNHVMAMCSRPSCYVCITHTLTLAAYEHFLTNHRKYPKVSSQLGKYIYIQSVSQFSQLGKYIYIQIYICIRSYTVTSSYT